jgi:hypothetical protein
MFKSLKQFAKKLAGGSKITRKVSQKGGDTKEEKTKKANSYMKMLLLKQKEAENNKIAEMKAKRKNQNNKNLARSKRAHKTKGTTNAIKPSNNVLEQYNSIYQPTERAAVMWEGFDKKTMNDIRSKKIAHNKTILGNTYVHHNNRLAPRQNQIKEAERYNLNYAYRGQTKNSNQNTKKQALTKSQLYGNHSGTTSGLYLKKIIPEKLTVERPLRKSFKGNLYKPQSPKSSKSPTKKRKISSSPDTSSRKTHKSSSSPSSPSSPSHMNTSNN